MLPILTIVKAYLTIFILTLLGCFVVMIAAFIELFLKGKDVDFISFMTNWKDIKFMLMMSALWAFMLVVGYIYVNKERIMKK